MNVQSEAPAPQEPQAAPKRSPKRRAMERQRLEAERIEKELKAAAGPARPRRRHWGILTSFLCFVVAPAFLTGTYLFERASDQFASFVGFTVRQANSTPAIELLGGITDLSSSSSNDTDVLHSYFDSQELVSKIQDEIDLASIWSIPENDPLFSFDIDGSIEDLVAFWKRMVSVSYDKGSGLLEVRALAFDPVDAQSINLAIASASTDLIDDLSAIAMEDTTRFAREDLDRAIDRLKDARVAITAFRNENQIVDPQASLQGQLGLMSTLQQQLAAALIDFELLRETTRTNDPRMSQAERRIEVIENQIQEERQKLGIGTSSNETGAAFATMVGEYESLAVDLEFAQRAYTSALAAYDIAVADAGRRSRYLAVYQKPTLAETAEYPQRTILFSIALTFLILAWTIGVLVFYSVKDRQARL